MDKGFIKFVCHNYIGCKFSELENYSKSNILTNDDKTEFISYSKLTRGDREWIYFNIKNEEIIKQINPRGKILFVCLLSTNIIFLISESIKNELLEKEYACEYIKNESLHMKIVTVNGKYNIHSKAGDDALINIDSKTIDNIMIHIVKSVLPLNIDTDINDILPFESEIYIDELEHERTLEHAMSDITLFSKEQVISRLKKISDINTKIVTVKSGINKMYLYRDAYQVELIKKLRNYKCQFCGTSIIKKCGGLYVEGCHIRQKTKGGNESLSNILILCPNCHKTFDLGDRKDIEHNTKNYIVEVNGRTYNIIFENIQ